MEYQNALIRKVNGGYFLKLYNNEDSWDENSKYKEEEAVFTNMEKLIEKVIYEIK